MCSVTVARAGENLRVCGGEVVVVLGYAAEAVQASDHDAVEVHHTADLLRYSSHAIVRGSVRIHTYRHTYIHTYIHTLILPILMRGYIYT